MNHSSSLTSPQPPVPVPNGSAASRSWIRSESIQVSDCVLFAGSYADYTVSSNRSDDAAEHGNSVGREETLKSSEAKFPLQFKPSKVTEL